MTNRVNELTCKICNCIKVIEDFSAIKYTKYGVRYQCKPCYNIIVARRRHVNSTRKKYVDTFSGFCSATFQSAKTNARAREIYFNLPLGYIKVLWDKQEGKCAVTGLAMQHTARVGRTVPPNDFKASIDRIDSEKGYTPDNVRLVCWFINDWKKNRSDDTLLQLIKIAYDNTHKNSSAPV